MALDLNDTLGHPRETDTVSAVARGLMGSGILKVAAEIRELVAKGHKVCNLTVGDFSSREFPIPDGAARPHRRGAQGRGDQLPPGGRHARAASGRAAVL